ncbi:MAG: hypothetical protein AAF921_28265 [Cyanobacteria bacterium P01_D01_bin.44]
MFYRHGSSNWPLSIFALASAIALNLAPLSSSAVAATAQPTCPGDNHIPTATTTRTVEFHEFGVQVTIPANFRTLLYNDGTVAILHPVDFNLIQCLTLGLPVLGTDALQPESFRLISNPEGLTAQNYAMSLDIPGFALSETIFMQTANGIQVFIREALEQEGMGIGIAYAWYQPDDINGIVEISTATKDELLDLLSRTQLINGASDQI